MSHSCYSVLSGRKCASRPRRSQQRTRAPRGLRPTAKDAVFKPRRPRARRRRQPPVPDVPLPLRFPADGVCGSLGSPVERVSSSHLGGGEGRVSAYLVMLQSPGGPPQWRALTCDLYGPFALSETDGRGRANAGAVRGASDFLESCVGDVRAASCHMVSACDKVEKPLV